MDLQSFSSDTNNTSFTEIIGPFQNSNYSYFEEASGFSSFLFFGKTTDATEVNSFELEEPNVFKVSIGTDGAVSSKSSNVSGSTIGYFEG